MPVVVLTARDGETDVVDVDVSDLRRELGAHAVQTVRGTGYRLPS